MNQEKNRAIKCKEINMKISHSKYVFINELVHIHAFYFAPHKGQTTNDDL